MLLSETGILLMFDPKKGAEEISDSVILLPGLALV